LALMTLRLRPLPHPDSFVARLDPRWKLAAMIVAALAVSCLRGLLPALVALAAALILVGLGRLPLRWYLSRIGALALFLLLFVAFAPLLIRSNDRVFPLGPLSLPYGPGLALLICVKAVAVVTIMVVLLVTSPLSAHLTAAHALRVPGLLVQLAMLAYRYVFVVSAELARMRVALRVRGYRNRASRHSYHTVGQVAGSLLVRGYERAERVGQAMRCRGFDGRFRALAECRTRAADVLFFLAIAGGAVVLVVWDLVQR